MEKKMQNESENTLKLCGNHLMVWVDKSGVICIKTVDPYNDPVELSENEAEELSDWLRKEIKKMRR